MKKWILVLMLALIGLSVNAQIMFQKTYGDSIGGIGNCVIQTFDGGYAIAGSDSGYACIIKTNVSGDTIWTKKFKPIYGIGSTVIQQTIDSGYIISAQIGASPYGVYLIKVNSIGDTAWTKYYQAPANSGTGAIDPYVQQTIDGGYLITASDANIIEGMLQMIKTNALGDTLWTKIFPALATLCFQQTKDSGFIMLGILTASSQIIIMKTDSNGDTLWTKEYSGGLGGGIYTSQQIQQTTDGGYIVTGTISLGGNEDDVFLLKTNSNGDTLWSRTFGGIGYSMGNSVQQTTDGGYIIVGQTKDSIPSNYEVYLIRTDSLGDTLWTKTYGGTKSYAGTSVCQTTDDGFIITGTTDDPNGNGKILLIKTDSNGNSGCNQGNPATIVGSLIPFAVNNVSSSIISGGIVSNTTMTEGSIGQVSTLCYTGINEISISSPTISLFPNPFSTTATLVINGVETLHATSLQIFNLLGQEVKTIPITNQKEIIINKDNLPSGMYFYKIIGINNETMASGKMIMN